MRELIPLQQSHEHNAFEGQLKQLAMALYEVYLADAAQNINVYGTPYLGNRDLLQKNLVADGIGNFEAENVDSSILKYLHMARRYRNGKRGLHLLNTYLRCLWSENYKAYQLYFAKDGVYAQDSSLFSIGDIAEFEQDIEDFILTSRVRVELDPTITPAAAIPADIANSLDDTLPARLFIHDIVVRRDVHETVGVANHSNMFSMTTEIVTKFELETAVYLSSAPYPLDEVESLQTSLAIVSFEVKDVVVEVAQPKEAFKASHGEINNAQLRNVLTLGNMPTEVFKASHGEINSVQIRNVLALANMPIEVFKAGQGEINGVQLRNVLLSMEISTEQLQHSIQIESFSIDEV